MSPVDANAWESWCTHVLSELKRLNESVEDVKKEITSLKVELGRLEAGSGTACYDDIESRLRAVERDNAVLKVKSGFWGGIMGLASAMAALLMWWLTKAK